MSSADSYINRVADALGLGPEPEMRRWCSIFQQLTASLASLLGLSKLFEFLESG